MPLFCRFPFPFLLQEEQQKKKSSDFCDFTSYWRAWVSFLERSGTCLHLLFFFQQHKLYLCWKTNNFLFWKTRVRILVFYFATIGENLQFWSQWLLFHKTIFSRTRQKNHDKNVSVSYQSWERFCNISTIIAAFKD